jgi:K+-sensing histidine kinase KdpD
MRASLLSAVSHDLRTPLASITGALFENADKYTPAGSPIVVRARRQDERVAIDVVDQGTATACSSPPKAARRRVSSPATIRS